MMSSMIDKNSTVVWDVVSVMSKIMDHKLNGLNYLDWSKTIRLYLRKIEDPLHIVVSLLKGI